MNIQKKAAPSMDEWMREAKSSADAGKCGMFLFHNGVVRNTAKAQVRGNAEDCAPVTGMNFSYDANLVRAAVERARRLPGIYYVRVWLNEGRLKVGDDLMLVLIGGDIRPRVLEALSSLVAEIKDNCVSEKEIS
ncbi:MAG: molybdenum cofactor biosynthesis protein MoaE [Candidatus Limivicinus sp.]|jgi:molybdopterin synthase catalytic subunit